jgi:hypothetical protein
VAMSCADGSEAENSIKYGEFVDQLKNKWPLENDSDPWSLLFVKPQCCWKISFLITFNSVCSWQRQEV